MKEISVLFVCLGNICRSPAGEGILRYLAERSGGFSKVDIMSCGTGSWHEGEFPDERMRKVAEKRGISLKSRARRFDPVFFDRFDYILAADKKVLEDLRVEIRQEEDLRKIHLINDFNPDARGEDVPDPYYGGDKGFEHVFDMLENACQGFLRNISETMK